MDSPTLNRRQHLRRVGERIRRVRSTQPARSSTEAYAQMEHAGRVDWTQSAAFLMDKSALPCLSAEESLALIKDAGGRY